MNSTLDLLNQPGEHVLDTWSLEIKLEDVIRMQSADARVVIERNPTLVGLAERAMGRGSSLIDPKVLYQVLKVEARLHTQLQLAGGLKLQSELLAQHLGSAEVIVVALCTIGDGVEKLAKEQFHQDPGYAFALEGFGSAAVEALATEFCVCIDENAARSGFRSSIPLSPGMVGWPVESGQRELFHILDSRKIGVELTESSMMLPVKTISLILGLGEDLLEGGSTCDYCSMRERCHYRDHYIHVEKS